MSFRDIISAKSGIPLEKIPDGYQVIGNIMLLKFLMPLTAKEKNILAESVLKDFSRIETICEIKGVGGELRKPAVSIIKSRTKKPGLETTHKEHDILFKLDVGKIMFSKGNLNERSRLINAIQPGEVIVDMFAGIGYFSLGIAKFSQAKRIYTIEKNPLAFRYLKENMKLNKVNNITPRLGDCRRIRIKEKAGRVIMGYFPGTARFLPYALRFLKGRGVVHYHNIYHESELWSKPLKEIESACKKTGFSIASISGRNFVKSYAPGIWHVCVDFGVEKSR